jgi:hypothetical protein
LHHSPATTLAMQHVKCTHRTCDASTLMQSSE